jgi:tRNA-specific 2-thiouridylase
VRLDLDVPVDAVAPGQAAVLYDGDLVLGGGTVSATGPAGGDPTPGGGTVAATGPLGGGPTPGAGTLGGGPEAVTGGR